MQKPPFKRRLCHSLAACVAALVLQGCNNLGPDAIRGGRLAYNEAIAETNNQQMLMVPVHNRYEESNHLLNVASVTANVRVSTSTMLEAGFGNSDNYDGNLVPFRGGFVYEENPTISYRPVAGEAYLQQLSSPIPLSLFARMTQVLPEPEFVYGMILASVNDIYNPAFLYEGQQDDPRFDQLITLMASLKRDRRLHWVTEAKNEDSLSLLIQRPDGDESVVQMLSLLGLPTEKANDPQIVIPVSLALDGMTDEGIGMTTRSLWELIEILSAAVQVPVADQAQGVATNFPDRGRVGRELQISWSANYPEGAYVAVEYRDGWFSIGSSDLATKRYFKFLGSLWSAAITESLDDTAAAPVLTVPVSR